MSYWGTSHDITYRSNLEEKIVGPFSFRKLAWLLPGLMIAHQLSQIVPDLPFDSRIYSKAHLLIPIAITAVFAYFRHGKTNLTLLEHIQVMWAVRRRRRSYYYARTNLSDQWHYDPATKEKEGA